MFGAGRWPELRRERSCILCCIEFLNLAQLRRHQLEFHGASNLIFSCSFCSQLFTERLLALQHSELHHLRIRFFLRTKRYQASLKSFMGCVELLNRNFLGCIVESRAGIGELKLHRMCAHESELLAPTEDETEAFYCGVENDILAGNDIFAGDVDDVETTSWPDLSASQSEMLPLTPPAALVSEVPQTVALDLTTSRMPSPSYFAAYTLVHHFAKGLSVGKSNATIDDDDDDYDEGGGNYEPRQRQSGDGEEGDVKRQPFEMAIPRRTQRPGKPIRRFAIDEAAATKRVKKHHRDSRSPSTARRKKKMNLENLLISSTSTTDIDTC